MSRSEDFRKLNNYKAVRFNYYYNLCETLDQIYNSKSNESSSPVNE